MPEFLKSAFNEAPNIAPFDVFIRLLIALVLGCAVAWVYRRTRTASEMSASFPTTLVLLSVLIAMSTQVIGDNVARAFSLVGALSIVRFRTVVRDTQDTAYVIFAVVIGMAVGARNPWVAVIGLLVIGVAAFLLMIGAKEFGHKHDSSFLLNVRLGLGHDLEKSLGGTLNEHLQECKMFSIGTAREGASLDVTYQTRLRPDGSASELVYALNRIEGVQKVKLERRGSEQA